MFCYSVNATGFEKNTKGTAKGPTRNEASTQNSILAFRCFATQQHNTILIKFIMNNMTIGFILLLTDVQF